MSTEELQDMESRVIEAAKRVFVRKGYEATKMGDIALEVGISRTAMHYYFRTKEMLFDAIFGQLMDALLPNIGVIVSEPTSFLEKIPKIVEQYTAMIQANPLFPIFVVNEFNRDPEHLYKTILKDPEKVKPLLLLQKQMREEMERGLLKKVPLVYTASTLLSLIVFPMLARNPLTSAFFEGDPRKFEDFLQERKAFITDVMVRLLTPDETQTVKMNKRRMHMKQTFLHGWKQIALLLVFPLMAEGAGAQERITLGECYEWAHANYPQIRQYGLIEQTERYNLSNAAKGWMPQLSVNAKATYQSDVTKLPFDADKLSAIIPGIEIPTLSKDQYQVVAEVNQTIWDGGVIRSTRQLTEAQATADREQLNSDLYTLNDRVNQLYFGCLLQDELIRQNGLLQKELQINIDRISAMMENGVANQSDRESMEVELLNARQKEIELKAARSAYGKMLAALIGRPDAGTFVLEVPSLPEAPSLSPVINGRNFVRWMLKVICSNCRTSS